MIFLFNWVIFLGFMLIFGNLQGCNMVMPNLELLCCLGEPASKLWGCIDHEQSIHNVVVLPLSANPINPKACLISA